MYCQAVCCGPEVNILHQVGLLLHTCSMQAPRYRSPRQVTFIIPHNMVDTFIIVRTTESPEGGSLCRGYLRKFCSKVSKLSFPRTPRVYHSPEPCDADKGNRRAPGAWVPVYHPSISKFAKEPHKKKLSSASPFEESRQATTPSPFL